MMRRDATWFLLSTCVIAGSAWWVARSNAAVERAIGRLTSAVEQPRPREASPAACAVSLDPRVLRSEVQRALSGVRLDGEASAQARTEPVALPEPEPGPTPEQIKAFDAATGIIDRALSRRTWTGEDVEQMRPIMIELDPSNREEIMLRVVRSLNEGKLEPTGRLGELF